MLDGKCIKYLCDCTSCHTIHFFNVVINLANLFVELNFEYFADIIFDVDTFQLTNGCQDICHNSHFKMQFAE